MKVKIPKQIRVGSHIYLLSIDNSIWKEECQQGQANHFRKTIKVDPHIVSSERNVTLLHETIHVISAVYNVAIEEADVDRIAQGMAELLFNNLEIEFDWSEHE